MRIQANTHPRALLRPLIGIAALIACVLVFGLPGSSQDADGAKRVSAEEADEHGPLHEAMEELQSGMRKIRKMLSKPEEKEAAIELLRHMQANALVAFQNPPEPGSDVGPSRVGPGWRIGFKRQILKVIDELLAVEHAVAEGRSEDAKAGYATLASLKKEGHDDYQVE